MNISKNIEKYLLKHAEPDIHPISCGSLDGIDCVVVIPALSELDSLFATLASLSQNPEDDLSRTLALCVINNRKPGCDPADYKNNQATLNLLKALIRGGDVLSSAGESLPGDLRLIQKSGLRLACLDASSEGFELPDKGGGVGLARKIGMDKALSLFNYGHGGRKLIYCLDADTRVAANYLPKVHDGFMRGNRPAAATVAYAHEMPDDPDLRSAICCYEIYLRYYVGGLQYAGSPYAFHTIGSTMVVAADAYASVRGMNKLDAAEDFYFLNKLAKIGPIRRIDTTRVYPAARPSQRVPFGTGRRMRESLAGTHDGYRLYDPQVFSILRQWLLTIAADPDQEGGRLCAQAKDIHPLLAEFLCEQAFFASWEKIRENSRRPLFLARQFHFWFDGFKTLKLIHYLNDRSFPAVGMVDALETLLAMMRLDCPVQFGFRRTVSSEEQRVLLNYLRQVAP